MTQKVFLVADNIISPLGFSAKENYRRLKEGESGVRRCEDLFGVHEPFMAALIDDNALDARLAALFPNGFARYTSLERAAILSVAQALAATNIDPAHPRVLFVLSSTKGNTGLLESPLYDNRLPLYQTAKCIAEHFGNPNAPITVSNACISGAYALLAAKRELDACRYDYAVVVGVDRLSRFIVSGFQSFKALSKRNCKPFDAARSGLNLGEAAATIILQRGHNAEPDDIILLDGAVRNDANHISGPSRTGEGLYLALSRIMQGRKSEQIAFVNAHGTATPYNDEMEAVALHRAGLDKVPVNGLKACFGHTLGAAGILESIISVRALHDGLVLKTQGYKQQGTTHSLPVTTQHTPTQKTLFIKMLSGFGGCNAALLFKKV